MNRLLIIALVIWVNTALADETYYTQDDFYRVEKIDMHMHLHSAGPEFMNEIQRDHFRVLSINVDYADFPPLSEQKRIARILLKKYPANFAYATSFSVRNFEQSGWVEQVIRQIDDDLNHGAAGVKVWKNIGMALRASDGKMVMIDDPHFEPIFDHLEKIHIPLLGHQGEPKNCWLPAADMSVSNDREYFSAHPQYYMYLHPDMPSYENQIDARDHMLSQHPNLQFVGLHLASLEWSVDKLAQFLDRFPHANVDLAARIGQLQFQSSQDRDKVRNFLIKYQDRVMYATDLDQEPDLPIGRECDAACKQEVPFPMQARLVWLRDWRYFTSSALITVPELDNPVRGLQLPTGVIDKIYYQNAQHQFPNSWKASFRTNAP